MQIQAPLAAAPLVGVAFFTGCAIPRAQFDRVEQLEFETSPLTELDLSTFNGSIEVLPSASDVVIADITYRAYGSTPEEAQTYAERMDCNAEAEDGTLKLTMTKPKDLWMASASVKLQVPDSCALSLSTSNGRVSVSDFTAPVHVHTSNGRISLTRIAGDVVAQTSNGVIEVKDVLGTVQLKTSNGKIVCGGSFVGTENKISTSNGQIELHLDENACVEVDASTSNGSIKSSMEAKEVIHESKHSLHAIVGGGSPESQSAVKLRTSNGSIRIKLSEPAELPEPTQAEDGDAQSLVL